MSIISISYRSDFGGVQTKYDRVSIGEMTGRSVKIVKTPGQLEKTGLLIIPGAARKQNPMLACSRQVQERHLIRDSMKRGRPTLCICAGLWRLLETPYGNNERIGKTMKAHHHTARRMPIITKSGRHVGYNIQMHRLQIKSTSLLACAMYGKNTPPHPTCNSVHWLTCDPKTLHPHFKISARAMEDQEVSPKGLTPEPNTVEAIESRFGTPIIAVQWHPEAYLQKKPLRDQIAHQNLIHFMAKAGDAFVQKQKVLEEVKKTRDTH